MPPNHHTPAPGLEFDGYRLIRFLGRGGFGDVWLCRSEAMGDFRALKWIPGNNADRLEKEHQSLLHYRNAAARLRTPHLVPIEHVNRLEDGLFYVMPLADGIPPGNAEDPAWQPLSLAMKIQLQAEQPTWFTSAEIIALIHPVLKALQTLTDAGLVHRDVKPENILFFNGSPCLGDISLLGEDAYILTRRGTPGYATPSWYCDGLPDMYGAAATLYTLLTGNSPDKMGRSAFLWPPQGESSLSADERLGWKRLHAVIRRATEEKVSERYVDFRAMSAALGEGSTRKGTGKVKRVAGFLSLAGLCVGALFAGILGDFSKSGNDSHPNSTPEQAELTEEEQVEYQALAGMIAAYAEDGHYENALASVDMLRAKYPQARSQPIYSAIRATILIGLERHEEAKDELLSDVNISPMIVPITERKKIWEELGDLESAEFDLSRVLNTFGPNTLVLAMRADIRAQRQNYAGVEADRQAAYAIRPGDPEQVDLTDIMWAPLERNHPGYVAFLESRAEK